MIPFIDLNTYNQSFEEQFNAKLHSIFLSGTLILGKEVSLFESNFAKFCGTNHCVGVGNGLDALTLIFKGYIELGRLQLGDKVIVPANTYVASVLAIVNAGLHPVLLEPNEDTFNLCPIEAEKHIDSNVKAILVVHLYGQLADMKSINHLAKSNNLLVIEDAAQAHGAENSIGLRAGNLSDAAAFSFYPTKNLGALGDGGAITTNDDLLANLLKKTRNYGRSSRFEKKVIGFNSRLDEIHAAFLNIKLPTLDQHNQKRRVIAKYYIDTINNPKIKLPFFDETKNHVFHLFVVRVNDREKFCEYLDKNQVGYSFHYPIPPHKQKCLQLPFLHLPITEKIHDSVVSIPISPILSVSNYEEVANILNRY